MITQKLLIQLRELGYRDSDIAQKLEDMGWPIKKSNIWRQRKNQIHSKCYPYLEKLLKEARKKQN